MGCPALGIWVGASGCFKKATQIPKAGHPIFSKKEINSQKNVQQMFGNFGWQ
jgi:hypothetical protein